MSTPFLSSRFFSCKTLKKRLSLWSTTLSSSRASAAVFQAIYGEHLTKSFVCPLLFYTSKLSLYFTIYIPKIYIVKHIYRPPPRFCPHNRWLQLMGDQCTRIICIYAFIKTLALIMRTKTVQESGQSFLNSLGG